MLLQDNEETVVGCHCGTLMGNKEGLPPDGWRQSKVGPRLRFYAKPIPKDRVRAATSAVQDFWCKRLVPPFALSWKAPQEVDADHRGNLRQRYTNDLQLRLGSLPSRFHQTAQKCLDSMKAIMSLPMVLSITISTAAILWLMRRPVT